MANVPSIGKKAPSFTLPAIPEGKVKLSDYSDKQNVVLYFYPRDNTPGCTQEACDFRDNLASLNDADTVVLGVSTDSAKSHQKFAEKFSLTFPLLADEDHAVAEKYGVWVEKKNYGKTYMGLQRSTFLIGKDGKVKAVWPNVKVKGHVADVAAKVAELHAE
ncbi:thioredoxin-dependent thiol peroxidase [Planctomicrobium piriforme]|uniref:thioredoxin-dependent peroxiredoxin n=1 Tax=Planctomicrobium piriforme TaxID=1576369 RepID=A0A1I3N7N6_9PLAN|nr:thioredoxin-dependent thiol peroxidase [Planctomicrobium piriforme]SFJ05257.1 peroxiredoxin Q/BCP [Planctomicrobium piriforme]